MNAVQEFISITPWTIIFQICNLLILLALGAVTVMARGAGGVVALERKPLNTK